ncbi:LysM peptidoglycan-binding domain-containing protein [bacterium]|nr:LysM peptidoglycan-binding domain-containing protein [bacterium]
MRYLIVWAVLISLFSIPAMAQSSSKYVVKPGDTLYSIATAYAMSVEDLKALNNIDDGVIRSGMELIIRREEVKPAELGASGSDSKQQLDGGSNESLASVADKLGLTVDEVLLLNPEIQQVIDRLNSISPAVERTTGSYTVKAGDTMFSIAKANGLSVAQLSELNGFTNTSIRSGQRLNVPGTEPAGSSTWSSLGVVDAVTYPETFSTRLMAGQIAYDESLFVVGHATLPIGSLIMIGKANEGPTVLCIVAEESLAVSMHILDVSMAVAKAVGLQENERIEVFTLK